MKRQRLLTVFAAVTALSLFASACGDDDDDATSDTTAAPAADTTAAPDAASTTAPAAPGEPFRVALFYPGSNDDLSWSNAWYDGAQAAIAANPYLEVEFVELLNEPDAYVQQGSAFAAEGYDFILFAHGAMVDPAIEVATNFPDTQVCQAPHNPTPDEAAPPPNLCFLDIAQHNADFLTGVIAALVSKSGKIASINGFEFPALTRQPESFNLGARCVNPDIQFDQEYINTWTDTAVAKGATQALIADGADVILSATDQAVLGVIDAAKEASSQVWVVPSYYDSFTIAPEVVLTSAVHGLAEVSQVMIEKAAAGQIVSGEFYDFDATNTAGIAAAPLYDNASAMGAEQKAIFDDIEAKVRSGAIKIPDETDGDPTIGSVGSGQSIDVASIGCTPAA